MKTTIVSILAVSCALLSSCAQSGPATSNTGPATTGSATNTVSPTTTVNYNPGLPLGGTNQPVGQVAPAQPLPATQQE